MNKSKKEKIEKIIEIIFKIMYGFLIATVIICLLWGIVSYIEIFCKNVTENPVYSEWNLFNIFVEKFNS